MLARRSACRRPLAPLAGLAALAALTLAAAPGARAQTLTYTLSNVTFYDGATASGFFNFDPTAQTFGGFDITTTDGQGFGPLGSHYSPATASASDTSAGAARSFQFTGGPVFPGSQVPVMLALDVPSPADAPGAYGLASSSGEVTPIRVGPLGPGYALRGISGGSLVVTAPPAAVPEPGALWLLAPGLGLLGLRARRRRA